MAQQTQTPGGQKKSSGAAPPATASSNGFLGGLRSFFAPAPPANGASTTKGGSAATPARPTLNLRKVITGFLLLLVGVYAIQFLLLFLDLQVFKGKLQTTILVQVPLLGPLSIFSALALASMIGLYILLYRLDLLPRANRATAQASAANANNRARAAATKKPVEKSATVRQPVSGPHDDEYEQARLAQRARRRRDARK
ncbi:MAG TPA: hypothetical protein VHR15_04275 [Ktedonobacterales bacterium]|jgi:hypothetical protein|nr:hypothetical protein [Ktedonobacterales bacterium]